MGGWAARVAALAQALGLCTPILLLEPSKFRGSIWAQGAVCGVCMFGCAGVVCGVGVRLCGGQRENVLSLLPQCRVLGGAQGPPRASLWPGCGVEAGASAGETEGHPWVSPRVVYRTVYRQVVKTEHRLRLRCCRGFYESHGACVRECWGGWAAARAWATQSFPTPTGGAAPPPSASPALSVSRDKAATSDLCL